MKKQLIYILTGLSAICAFSSCDKTKSYSELLNEEERAVNWFLANQEIVPYVPADSVFKTGPDAPFYKMDEDGYVYMQVINPGSKTSRPKKGETVYFRYKYRNLKDLANGVSVSWTGNADDLTKLSTSLVYGNRYLDSTTGWGEGIQVPLDYLGYDSEVNLVIKSPKGIVKDQTLCIPLEYNVKYFKAEY